MVKQQGQTLLRLEFSTRVQGDSPRELIAAAREQGFSVFGVKQGHTVEVIDFIETAQPKRGAQRPRFTGFARITSEVDLSQLESAAGVGQCG